ncbi:PhzF family phenazine biosynthesis protein [Frankia sp. AgB1.9]|uniref:PhzF family phenazine biosynthesis isomerase n=1 Tax=unclassified Frankia TaxID=2632575 RepID=UPI001933BAD9|nr:MULTISPECIES: PhzF family phenazine biosynthesis isomerase [unclassified Frankia]MBL7494415.1 PhzF family phenazine biosynthesis protein [Frankia sp. AgW1.1]MBL7551354.1 PhzF family phenazine biosynthesis protein [Frankia sp. AgB1.9]MBL7624161.1 PhzF family phenazine biosynthesis protein [Frankia sp. AgB1.8]
MVQTLDVLTAASCLRDGAGGSPTAVITGSHELGEADLARVPARMGASHLAVVGPGDGVRELRFFTSAGELPNCGHAAIAAIAVLALARDGFQGRLRAAGREFEAAGTFRPPTGPAGPALFDAWFDQGVVDSRAATTPERDAFLAALGLAPDALHADDDVSVASPGRERLLVPVADRTVLAALRPDQDRLADASRRHGQLGCFVYVPPSAATPAAARMFAPAIGVPEDVANANSTGCLAAHLLATGRDPAVAVDQGDALGHPSTVWATATRTAGGIATRVGGAVHVRRSSRVVDAL